MSDLSYVYKPKALSMGFGFAFFAVGAATFANLAIGNDRGLIINGLVDLDPGQATLFYWGMCVTAALMALGGIFGLFRALTSRHTLSVDDTGVRLPKSTWGDAMVTVQYAHIKDLVRQQVKGQQFLVIHHVRGKSTIMASWLPSRGDFDEVCRLITERVVQARRG